MFAEVVLLQLQINLEVFNVSSSKIYKSDEIYQKSIIFISNLCRDIERPTVEAVIAEEDDELDNDIIDDVSELISGHTDGCLKIVTSGYYKLDLIDEFKVFLFDIKWRERSIEIGMQIIELL